MNTFKNRLKECRKASNLTQKQLASILNTTDDSVYSWEKGRAEPSIEMIKKICIVLEITSDYLIGLSNDYLQQPQNIEIKQTVKIGRK